jgi:hypothetical protein
MFTGRTALEQVSDELQESAPQERDSSPRDLVAEGEDCAVRWLGMDVFHEGDDIKVAVHKAGHAVLVLVSEHMGAPCSVRTIKLSKDQWKKLREIVKGK